MMEQLIKNFPAQIKDALLFGEDTIINPHHSPINKIIVSGMGGSAIAGTYISDLIEGECTSPCFINRSYHLPAFADKNTLIIISSYSGNTEETVTVFHQALLTYAKIVCITSGGKILDIAIKNGVDIISMPEGCESPRAFLGYSIVYQLFVLRNLSLISGGIINQLRPAVDLLTFEQEDIMAKAEKIAVLLLQKTPVIYTSDRMEAVALRWRQQLNENSKILCWHNVLPEMNHNELVGWKNRQESVAVVILRYKDDHKRIQTRIELTKQVIGQLAATVIEIYAKGQSQAEKMLYMTHLGDWVSWHLSQLNHLDSTEIRVIDFLKAELEKSEM